MIALPAEPDRLALDDGARRVSRSELAERISRTAGTLAAHGAGPGTSVALVMRNRVEFLETVMACMLLGSWCVPVNWHLVAEEVRYIIDDSGSTIVVCDAESRAQVPNAHPAVLCVDGSGGVDLAAGARFDVDIDAIAGQIMYYTSGTTGRPKGVRVVGRETVAENAAGWAADAARSGLDDSGPHLVTGPLYHGAPLVSALLAMAAGAPVVIMQRWDAEGFLRLVEQHQVRDTHLVPIMFVRLLRLPDDVRRRHDLSSLVTVHHGAAPVSVAVKRQMIDWFGPVLREYWASTDGGLYTEVMSEEWLEHPGTVGRPISGLEIFARTDAGDLAAPGEVGTLWVRVASVDHTFEYHGDPDKTARAYLDERTFSIGDIGYVDAEGYVFLTDRTSEVVISGGVNLYPAEVEHALLDHPDVLDAGVYGVPDTEWGEVLHAAIVAVPSADHAGIEDRLLAHVRAHLAPFKVPKAVRLVAELPRSDAGKLYRRRLRDDTAAL